MDACDPGLCDWDAHDRDVPDVEDGCPPGRQRRVGQPGDAA